MGFRLGPFNFYVASEEEKQELFRRGAEEEKKRQEDRRNLLFKKPPTNPIERIFYHGECLLQMIMSIIAMPISMALFLVEEALQAQGMGAYILTTSKQYETLGDYIETWAESVATAEAVTKEMGTFSPIMGGAVLNYIEAVKHQITAFEIANNANILKQAETDEALRKKLEDAAKYGTLRLSSTPDNAEIWIDGRNTELLTPETFKKMEARDYIFELRKYNTKTEEQDIFAFTVTIVAGTRKELNINIPKGVISEEEEEPVTYGQLRLTSSPSTAEIWINGENTGKLTPEYFRQMDVGTYGIKLRVYRISLEAWLEYEFKVTIVAGEKTELHILIPIPEKEETPDEEKVTYGAFRIISLPSLAMIFIDGTDTTMLTPETFTNLEPKSYNVELRHWNTKTEEFDTLTFIIDVEAGVKKELKVNIPVGTVEEEIEPELLNIGSFRIISAPEAAKIYIDDIDTGMLTPETFTKLTPKIYVVKLIRARAGTDEIQTLTTNIAVEKGKRTEIKLFFPEWEKPEKIEIPPAIIMEEETRLPIWIKASVIGDHAIDGDSFITFEGENIRILGIDAPEKGRPWSEIAQAMLHERIADNTVQLLIQSHRPKDQYGRTLAIARVSGDTVAFKLLEAGLARVYITPSDVFSDYNYLESEQVARDRKIGIWS